MPPGEKDSVAPDAHYPAFREELVCTLLEILLRHPCAMRLSQSPLAPGRATAAGPGEDRVGEGHALEMRPGTPAAGGAWEELQAAVHDVAAAQRTAELTEWLGCAKIALQVSSVAPDTWTAPSNTSPLVLANDLITHQECWHSW